ncbi:hypothetical protein [Bordetella sp. BOR01]|uniref:hypothetical protein n=1 Tax=Bordetella sp. BOR01 TaxID=2854779 RepID=UPI001C43B298|nr:hypothetical protein [Bordetella sp. BOR01]MBV7487076.1 hypothetical protein [Bordetella sp. BOR01]
MTAHTRSAPRQLCLSVREARLVVERILLTCDAPAGYVAAVRDTVLASQGLGLSGMHGLIAVAARAALAADFKRIIEMHEETTAATFNGAGLHAWCVVPTLADLLVADARSSRRTSMRVRNVREPEELACAIPIAGRYGVRLRCDIDPEGANLHVLRIEPQPDSWKARDPLLAHSLRHGYAMAEDAWWKLYAASNKALSPDSITSRRHAGPTIVQDDGTVIGRAPADDDTDLAMLRRSQAAAEGVDFSLAP